MCLAFKFRPVVKILVNESSGVFLVKFPLMSQLSYEPEYEDKIRPTEPTNLKTVDV